LEDQYPEQGLLTKDELELSATESVLRMVTRKEALELQRGINSKNPGEVSHIALDPNYYSRWTGKTGCAIDVFINKDVYKCISRNNECYDLFISLFRS
jgi:hypothetical protein